MQRHDLILFADYFQFYLQDEGADGDLSAAWTPEAVERLLAVAPGTVGVGTVRNLNVPVAVELHDQEPADDSAKWDHVTECSVEVPSGRLVVAGCTDYFPEARRIEVRARVSYGSLAGGSADGLNGEDHYRVAMWPGPVAPVRVVRQRRHEG